MKTGYRTHWVATASSDMRALAAQHQRVFPGNALAIVGGFVKVAVKDGDIPPKLAVSDSPVFRESLKPKSRI